MLIRGEKGFTLLEMLASIAIVFVLVASFYQLLSTFSKNFEIQDSIAEMQQQGRFSADLISREIRQTGYDPTGVFFDSGAAVANPDNNCIPGDPPPTVERILEASPTVFHYLADLNENGRPFNPLNPADRDPNEHVRYEWVGSLGDGTGRGRDVCGSERPEYSLYRNTGGGMQPVSSGIVSLNFQYFDDNNNPIPNIVDAAGNLVPNTRALTANERSEIWKVVLTLTARTDRPDSEYPENDGYRTRTFVYNVWLKNT